MAVTVACSAAREMPSAVDAQIAQEIARIKAIDHHAHPVRPTTAGEKPDNEFDALPVESAIKTGVVSGTRSSTGWKASWRTRLRRTRPDGSVDGSSDRFAPSAEARFTRRFEAKLRYGSGLVIH